MSRLWLVFSLAWFFTSCLCNEGRPKSQLAQELDQLVRQLGSDDLDKEAEARSALERLGKRSIPALRDAAKGSKDPVTRERASQMADMIDKLASGELRGFLGHTMDVNAVAFSPDGRQLLSASMDRTMRLWDARTGQELRRFTVKFGAFMAAAFSPDGRRIASGHWDHSVRVWDVATGKEEICLREHEDFITAVAWSPDGRRALSGSHDGYMRLWDVVAGKEIRAFEAGAKVPDTPGAREEISCVAISPDGKKALSAGTEGVVCVWDLEAGKLLNRLPKQATYVRSAIFSHDGSLVLSGDMDGVVRIWEIQTRKELHHLKARIYTKDVNILGKNSQGPEITSLAFSPDDRRVLSGHCDHTVRLWDAKTGKELACFFWHFNDVNSVAFSPDGKWALSGSRDTTVRLWTLPK